MYLYKQVFIHTNPYLNKRSHSIKHTHNCAYAAHIFTQCLKTILSEAYANLGRAVILFAYTIAKCLLIKIVQFTSLNT